MTDSILDEFDLEPAPQNRRQSNAEVRRRARWMQGVRVGKQRLPQWRKELGAAKARAAHSEIARKRKEGDAHRTERDMISVRKQKAPGLSLEVHHALKRRERPI